MGARAIYALTRISRRRAEIRRHPLWADACGVRAGRRNAWQVGADDLICRVRIWHPVLHMIRVSSAFAFSLVASACGAPPHHGFVGTVDLGDNFVAPDLALDEDFFYCRIQPEVIERFSCAGGASGEAGQCHDSRSALQLLDAPDRARCDRDGRLAAAAPDEYLANFEASQFFVQADPLTSPFLLRPTHMASHPRRIFAAGDPAARLITEWITAGAE